MWIGNRSTALPASWRLPGRIAANRVQWTVNRDLAADGRAVESRTLGVTRQSRVASYFPGNFAALLVRYRHD